MPINEDALPLITRLEGEVWDEYRELARRELEKRLQKQADKQGRFSPLDRNSASQMPTEGRDDSHPVG